MRRQYTDKQRSELIELVTTGRATASVAAARLGVTVSTAYYWMKRAAAGGPNRRGASRSDQSPKARALGPPTFVRLVRDDLYASIEVRIGDAEIPVRRGFDAQLLRAVVEALHGDAT